MGKIIAVASQKGGVGKTTTCLNLAVSLTGLGKKVLLVDCDPQGALAAASNLKRITDKGLVQLLTGELQEEDIVVPAGKRSLALVGSGVLETEDIFFLEQQTVNGNLGKAIRALSVGYDYTLLDTQAGLNKGLYQLFAEVDSVLLPCTCKATTVKTLPLFLKFIQQARQLENHRLQLEGVVLTMYNEFDPCALEVSETIQEAFPQEIFFRTFIPLLLSFEQASMRAIPVALLKQDTLAVQAYDRLAFELAARQKEGEGSGE